MKNKTRNILNESKRDEILQRFILLLKENDINVDVGTIKSKLLNKFVVEANIHNLSLRSNYYLAGVARYYFDGALTKNKNLSLLNKKFWEGEDIRDDWRTDVCAKLDALILFLRNSYIDTIGKEMLEKEDFGEIPIRDLFHKYQKEIRKQLGGSLKKKDVPEIDMSINVGNGYTFEIIYSQEDCTKYNEATSPRAWCITFSKGNYDYYIREYNIHYVIFRQNGYENIPRPKNPMNEPGFTPEKPQDAYGNSLIALLQSNTSPVPKLITSRWNHGYEVPCEADHAYTTEEFERITGVTDADLKRIYDIWKLNYGNVKRGNSNKKEELFVTRSLKYLQMRINAGENPQKLFDTTNHVAGSEKINKGTFLCSAIISETTMGINSKLVYFIFDNGKIVFESASYHSSGFKWVENKSLITIEFNENKNSIYSVAKHKMANVNGLTKFKRIPRAYVFSYEMNLGYFTVNQGKMDAALIDMETMDAIQLPNGEYWFCLVTSNSDSWNYGSRNKIKSAVFEKNPGTVLQILYDASSLENYFYSTSTNSFIDIPKPPKELKSRHGEDIQSTDGLIPMFTDTSVRFQDGTIAILYAKPSNWGMACGRLYAGYCESKSLLIKDGKPLNVNGVYWFDYIRRLMYNMYLLKVSENTHFFINNKTEILTNENGTPIKSGTINEGRDLIYIAISPTKIMLYEPETSMFLKNPFNQTGCEDSCVFHGVHDFFSEYGDLHGHGLTMVDVEIPSGLLSNKVRMKDGGFDGYDRSCDISERTLLAICEKVPANFVHISRFNNDDSININRDDIQQMVSEAISRIIRGYIR